VTLPRLLVIMGSGETSPTMVKAHRSVFDRLGPSPVPACALDTPFGFQANADELTARILGYFRDSIGADLDVASMRSADDPLAVEQAVAVVRSSRFVFAGPGSPSYALRQWQGTPMVAALAEKLESGGCVTFASAAALTLGAVTVPVYEIYKVGETPRWLPGLDLLARAGLNAAVIPHYDNAEGGTHDTRFCYLGEPRLAALEAELPDGAFVLGVDEHTGLILDLDEGTASVVGRGGVTIRSGGTSHVVPSGETVPTSSLTPHHGSARIVEPMEGADPRGTEGGGPSAAWAEFERALAAADADGATRAALATEADLGSSPELRQMIAALGAASARGLADPRAVVAPFIDMLLEARAAARAAGRYDESDAIRDRLVELGVEVRDTPDGAEWDLPS
jgi:hypothetical protein